MTTLIGLNGLVEAGKDTVADILRDEFGYLKLSIGEHIRREILTWEPDDFEIRLMPLDVIRAVRSLNKQKVYAKPTVEPVRLALQWFGLYRVKKNPSYWLSQVLEEMDAKPEHTHILISDVRMPLEYAYCKMHGQVWQVIRARAVPTVPTTQHLTETWIRNFAYDQYISNNGDLAALRKLVRLLVTAYGLEKKQHVLFGDTNAATEIG